MGTRKTAEQSFYFTEFGVSVFTSVNGVRADWFYKRCPDIDGLWKVVAKEGECGFLDACEEPEPMKVLLQTNSKFLPTELTMVAGEQWEAELPDLGKVLGLITEMRRTMMMVLKLGKKTITIMMKFNQNFLVQECDVDGEISSRMKVIMARQ